MNWSVKPWSCLIEGLAFSGFVAWYIWKLQASEPWTWAVMVVWVLVSFLARHDRPETIGWRADNLWSATKRALCFFGVCSILICIGGLFLGMLHRLPAHLISMKRFGGYLAFCLLQQVALNSFLTNRLLAAFEKPENAVLVAATIFGALHWPNPVLVPLTFIGGAGMAWLFSKDRNILPLTLGQAILGSLVWWAFPLAWHHSMRVGPGYRAFHM